MEPKVRQSSSTFFWNNFFPRKIDKTEGVAKKINKK